jgi:predicted ferric reductase
MLAQCVDLFLLVHALALLKQNSWSMKAYTFDCVMILLLSLSLSLSLSSLPLDKNNLHGSESVQSVAVSARDSGELTQHSQQRRPFA